MKAETISIGTEILLGQIVDTNSSYIAGRLPLLGIDLLWMSQVGDNRHRLAEVLSRAWGRSDLIITCGGLGPTDDDITREAIAGLLGEKMQVDPELERWLRGVFASLGYPMPERNLKQAMLIPSARAIPNPRGTAPGWWVEREGKLVLALPGPPGEMQRMWDKEIEPELRQRMSEVIVSRTLKTLGLSEARVDEMVSPLVSSTNPTLAVYAKLDGIQLRITAKAASREEADTMIAGMEEEVRSILGPRIWGTDEDTLEKLIGTQLQEKGLTLATMESFSGGLLASTISDVLECSSYFKGGLVAYSDEMKIACGIDADLLRQHGALSPEVTAAMAQVARAQFRADVGLGVGGVTGPEEAAGRPAGTVFIALDAEARKRAFQAVYPPRWPDLKRRAAAAALFELRQFLLDW